MKNLMQRLLILLWLMVISSQAWGGSWTANGFIYKPALGARGATEKNTYDTGQDRVDARLGKEIWVGDPNYGTSFQDAVTAIGSKAAILRIPPGTYAISSNLTIPTNITLKPERGAIFSIADTKTLTINGGLEAGLYQIFSCTGTGKVVFGARAVKEVYPEWWGGVADGTTDSTVSLQAAMNAWGGCVSTAGTGSVHLNGIYLISDDVTLPRRVSLIGSDPQLCGLVSSAGKRVIISTYATDNSMVRQLISKLDFNKVQLCFGLTDIPSAFGSIIDKCNIHGYPGAGIYFGYGVWENLIHACHIYQNQIGIEYDVNTTSGGTYSNGDPTFISDCDIFSNNNSGNGYGIYVNGCNADGIDLKITGTDIQHNDYAFYLDNNGSYLDNAHVYLNGVHLELNQYADIYNNNFKVYVDNVWAYSNTVGTWIANLVSAGSHSYTGFYSGVISWAANKLVKLTAGQVYYDTNKIKTTNIFAANPCTADTVGGTFLFPKSYIVSQYWGQSQALSSSPYTMDAGIWPGDNNTRHYHLHITTTAGTGTPVFYFRFWDLGASTYDDNNITLPNETGFAEIDVWVTASYITVVVRFDGSSTHQDYYHQIANTRSAANHAEVQLMLTGVTNYAVLNNYKWEVQ